MKVYVTDGVRDDNGMRWWSQGFLIKEYKDHYAVHLPSPFENGTGVGFYLKENVMTIEQFEKLKSESHENKEN